MPCTGFELTILVVICIDCTCSRKFNNHPTRTTTVPCKMNRFDNSIYMKYMAIKAFTFLTKVKRLYSIHITKRYQCYYFYPVWILHIIIWQNLFLRLTIIITHKKYINSSLTGLFQNVQILSCLVILVHRPVSMGIHKLHVLYFDVQTRYFSKYFSKPNCF